MTDQTRETTTDLISDGGLKIVQHRKGYRFGLDALLLCTDLPPVERGTVIDLGAAQGVVGLCIARRRPRLEVLCVERQPALARLARRNITLNELQDRVQVVEGDLREARDILVAHSARLVVCNPPYFPEGARRPSQNTERADARHERHGTLDDFVRAAAYALDQRGWLKIVVPPLRLADLLASTDSTDLQLHSLRFFHSRPHTPAYLLEAWLRRGGAPDLRIRPPLYIYRDPQNYSDEVRARVDRAALAPGRAR